MDVTLMVLYIAIILIYITVYINKGKGLWENIEVYTPNWSEKILILVFFYLFIILYTLSWYFNNQHFDIRIINIINKINFVITLLLFSFVIFCLSDGITSIEEAFIIASVIFGLVIINVIISFMFNDTNIKILSLLPLALYTYLYAWIYEIKNNY